MSIRGQLTIECDRKGCHAEIVLGPDECDLEPKRGGIEIDLYAYGWMVDDLEPARFVCPECVNEQPREVGEP